ncbi:MAG: DUF417 family protein [Candidatus Sungbacteria bacterium]|uniref:DUF417 family protein n=1 Tax=Candidatus Sungiibacteriota bacterium TaxID=2750080 RepID=A0A9D6QTH0_9BACT|nr:DUF417 family protein [Candidatus Sungbacteria bacterium]
MLTSLEREARRNENYFVDLLRVGLGLTFFWFGGLKFLGYNPVYQIVHATYPLLATTNGNLILGMLETLIGVGLLANVYRATTHVALVLHLSSTFLTFFIAPSIMFSPHFTILTLAGEFIFKNVILVTAGLVVFGYYERRD